VLVQGFLLRGGREDQGPTGNGGRGTRGTGPNSVAQQFSGRTKKFKEVMVKVERGKYVTSFEASFKSHSNMTSLSLSSAAGLLAQLDHTDSRIQAAALARIYPVVDTFWSEIQDSLLAIEGKRV
jgi:hypothetical protein